MDGFAGDPETCEWSLFERLRLPETQGLDRVSSRFKTTNRDWGLADVEKLVPSLLQPLSGQPYTCVIEDCSRGALDIINPSFQNISNSRASILSPVFHPFPNSDVSNGWHTFLVMSI